MKALARLKQSYDRIAPGDRRALLLMCLFLGAVGGYVFLLEPLLLRYQDARQRLEELAGQQRGYAQQVRVLPQREARWREHGAELQALQRHFELGEGDPHGAVARVIPELIDYARLCGLEVSGLRPLDPVAAGPYQDLPLEAEMEGDYGGLHRFFYLVDTSPAVLAVTEVDLRPLDRGRLRARLKISHVIRRTAGESGGRAAADTPEASGLLRLGTDYGADSAPLAVAERNGWLRQEGLGVQPVRLDDTANGMGSLDSGALDGLVASLPELLALQARGLALRVVLPLGARHGGQALVVDADSDVRTVADLRGARIGVDRREPLPFVLYALLRANGLAYRALEVRPLRRRLTERELLAGLLGAGLLAEPALSRLVQAGRVRVLADSAALPDPVPLFLAVTREAAKTKGEAVQLAVNGLYRALGLLDTRPEEGLRLTADWSGQGVEETRAALGGIDFAAPAGLAGRLSRAAPERLPALYRDYFTDTGRSLSVSADRDLVEPRFLERALREGPPAATGGAGHGQ